MNTHRRIDGIEPADCSSMQIPCASLGPCCIQSRKQALMLGNDAGAVCSAIEL
jgi:hypothetical protein